MKDSVSLKEYVDKQLENQNRASDKLATDLIEKNRAEFITKSEHDREIRLLERNFYIGYGIFLALLFTLKFFIK